LVPELKEKNRAEGIAIVKEAVAAQTVKAPLLTRAPRPIPVAIVEEPIGNEPWPLAKNAKELIAEIERILFGKLHDNPRQPALQAQLKVVHILTGRNTIQEVFNVVQPMLQSSLR
jgi:hypothetical protein